MTFLRQRAVIEQNGFLSVLIKYSSQSGYLLFRQYCRAVVAGCIFSVQSCGQFAAIQ